MVLSNMCWDGARLRGETFLCAKEEIIARAAQADTPYCLTLYIEYMRTPMHIANARHIVKPTLQVPHGNASNMTRPWRGF